MTHQKFWVKPHGVAIILFSMAMIIFEGYMYIMQLRVNWIGEHPRWVADVLAVCGAILFVAPKFALPSWAIYDYFSRDKSGGRIAGAAFIVFMFVSWNYIPNVTAPTIATFLQYLVIVEGLMAVGFAASVIDVSALKFHKREKKHKQKSNGSTNKHSSTEKDYSGFSNFGNFGQ